MITLVSCGVCVCVCVSRLEGGYEESPGSYMSQLEVYAQYLMASTKASIGNTLNNAEFNNLIR